MLITKKDIDKLELQSWLKKTLYFLLSIFYLAMILIPFYFLYLINKTPNYENLNRQNYLSIKYKGKVIEKKINKTNSTILILNNGKEFLTLQYFVYKVEIGDSIVKKENDSLAYVYKKDKVLVFNYFSNQWLSN